jgi:hypothetical protein
MKNSEFQNQKVTDQVDGFKINAGESCAGACIHPDHMAVNPLVTAAVFYARLKNCDRVPGGEGLSNTEPSEIQRLFLAQ